jgi:hypothetical protein
MEKQSEHIYYTLQVHSFDAPFTSLSKWRAQMWWLQQQNKPFS